MRHIAIFTIFFVLAMTELFGFDVNGQFTSDVRLAFDDGSLLFNQEYGTIGFQNRFDEKFFGMAGVSLRYVNNPVGMTFLNNQLTSRELSLTSAVGPFEISLDEAYCSFTDFIFPGVDIIVGKQRITWGTADKLNPTDLLNPLDFSDPLDFGKKIPSLALLLSYTFPNSDASIQFAFEPYSQIARWNPFMVAQLENSLLISGMITAVAANASQVITPEYKLENALYAAKVALPVLGFDLSANFTTRIADLPNVSSVVYSFLGSAVTSYTLSYFREYEIGFDFSKEWGGLLTWGEMGVFFQGEQSTKISSDMMPDSYQTTLQSSPYVKYTLGMSKKFAGGFYLNLQFNHGFFNERGEEGPQRCEDYLLLRLELTILDEKLTFGLTGLANVNNLYNAFGYVDVFRNMSENYGLLGGVDVQYKPSLNMSVKIGALFFDGTSSTTIGKMKDQNMLTFSFGYNF